MLYGRRQKHIWSLAGTTRVRFNETSCCELSKNEKPQLLWPGLEPLAAQFWSTALIFDSDVVKISLRGSVPRGEADNLISTLVIWTLPPPNNIWTLSAASLKSAMKPWRFWALCRFLARDGPFNSWTVALSEVLLNFYRSSRWPVAFCFPDKSS